MHTDEHRAEPGDVRSPRVRLDYRVVRPADALPWWSNAIATVVIIVLALFASALVFIVFMAVTRD
jgi:hypothetical protein